MKVFIGFALSSKLIYKLQAKKGIKSHKGIIILSNYYQNLGGLV